MNLTKYAQNMYVKSYKMLIKEIKENLNNNRYILCSWTGRLIIVEISILPNLIYTINTVPMKLTSNYFVDINKMVLTFTKKEKDLD